MRQINLVLHDWGSVLGFHWANRNRERVQSIIHMESLIGPIPSWDKFPEGGRQIFKAMRSDGGDLMFSATWQISFLAILQNISFYFGS